jgi:hypothetical protein
VLLALLPAELQPLLAAAAATDEWLPDRGRPHRLRGDSACSALRMRGLGIPPWLCVLKALRDCADSGVPASAPAAHAAVPAGVPAAAALLSAAKGPGALLQGVSSLVILRPKLPPMLLLLLATPRRGLM